MRTRWSGPSWWSRCWRLRARRSGSRPDRTPVTASFHQPRRASPRLGLERTYGVIAACGGWPGRWRNSRLCGSRWPSPGSSPCCCSWPASSLRVSSNAISTARSPTLNAPSHRTSRRWSRRAGRLRLRSWRARRYAQVYDAGGELLVSTSSARRTRLLEPAQLEQAARQPLTVERRPLNGTDVRLRAIAARLGNGERVVVVIGDSLSEQVRAWLR